MNIRHLLLLAAMGLLAPCLGSRSLRAAEPAARERVGQGFARLYEQGLQEKCTMLTDRMRYAPGDTVRLRAVLVDAVTHTPGTPSRYLHVALLDATDRIVQRVVLRGDTAGFAGYVALDAGQPAGSYTLVGWTRWMENAPHELFCRRGIEVLRPGSVRRTGSERAGERRPEAKRDRHQKPLPPDVQFMPEGGTLVAGVRQRIAFKAIGADGRSVEVEGRVEDETGREIARFTSAYRGMGAWEMTARPGARYRAWVVLPDGQEYPFELPAPDPTALALRCTERRDTVWIEVLTGPQCPDSLLRRTALFVHTRGVVHGFREGAVCAFDLPTAALGDGISHAVLFDAATGAVHAERLLFRAPVRLAEAQFTASRPCYGEREEVVLNLKLRDADGKAVEGVFGLTVAEAPTAPDAVDDNLLTDMLLTSDLGGTVEEPAAYFGSAAQWADLLMLTQGWRRFDAGALLRGTLPRPSIPFEQSMALEGQIAPARHDVDLLIYNHADRTTRIFEVPGGARVRRFRAEGMDFPEGTPVVVQALGPKGQTYSVHLTLSGHEEPVLAALPEPACPPAEGDTLRAQDGGMWTIRIDKVVVRARRPDEVGVFHRNAQIAELGPRQLEACYDAYDAVDRLPRVYVADDSLWIDYRRRMSLNDYLGRTGDLWEVSGEGAQQRSAEDEQGAQNRSPIVRMPVPLYVNGAEMVDYPSFLRVLPVGEILSLRYIPPFQAAYFGAREGEAGMIDMRVRDGVIQRLSAPPSLVKLRWDGYQQPVEVYRPHYERATERYAPQPDTRVTVAWEPFLRTDYDGTARIRFWTADGQAPYRVTLEGVAPDGTLCHAEITLRRGGE